MEILGIDIGGSGIKGALVNIETGELITKRHRISTPQPATPDAVTETVAELTAYFGWTGIIGCGFPAVVQNGIVRTAANIDDRWIGIDVADHFTKKTGCQVTVINDADAATLAEINFGAGRNRQGVILMITVGTGLGSTIINNGQLLPNTELGHVIFPDQIAEHYASDAVREQENLSWQEWGKRFNEYLTHIEFLFWPDLIIVGGGVSKEKRWSKFSEYLTTKTEVVPAQLENHAGVIGAAYSAKS